jgi:glycine/D-amino acid oxidase-like deaminating enzyme
MPAGTSPLLDGALHTPHGYWLEDVGPVAPQPPLEGRHSADVLIVGGGYTGLWTAWSVLEREPAARVAILERNGSAEGPSARNGGFVNSYWYYLTELRARYGDAGALAVARAAEAAAASIDDWCRAQGVDAWYRRGGRLAASASPAQDAGIAARVAVAQELGVGEKVVALDAEAVARRCRSPVFRSGALVPDGATVHPARLVRGLRERLLERGAAFYERSPVLRLDADGSGVRANTARGRLDAPAAVLAVHDGALRVAPLRRRLTASTSHMVITEPVPEALAESGWTGGEAVTDGRAFLHYFRTTPDHRIAFGWGGGRVAFGARTARVELDRSVVAQAARDLQRIFPTVAGSRITHAWGGPIDVSPTHLPEVVTLPGGRVRTAFGFTGNGVGPSRLLGAVLADLAVDADSSLTRLPLVDPPPVRVPPEPLRYAGGALVRAAFLRRERLEERGLRPDPATRAVCALPRMLGIHLGR